MKESLRRRASGGSGLIGPAAFALLATMSFAAAAQDSGIAGYWATGTEGVIVQIEPCGGSVCGKLVTLRPGGLTEDRHNEDEALQDRPLCNLVILQGFSQESPTEWVSGEVYDPESGNTYSGSMTLESADTLDLRGYVGIPLFGRTETWTRTEEPETPCG
ncbi:DUF2147 domain-containing protein [Inquilinus sp. CAU 1745]|uniref:DUF2147 domain-containing protein n=1 Tax=Inquilinus sp. CAU 1745 TaxID=3140369 RepID=UPI00325A867A